jgi:hypothetical protein
MLKVRRWLREFEVGTLQRRNSEGVGLVVLDPLAQTSQKPDKYITLFEVTENQLGEFRAETVLRLLGVPDQFARAEIEGAVDAYCRAAGIDPEVEWLNAQRGEAGLSCRVSTYAALRETYAGRDIPYEELLGTTEWLLKRAAILERDGLRCVSCSSAFAANGSRLVLQVHHRYYVREWPPWEYPDEALATLCLGCHLALHEKELVPVFQVVGGKLVKVNRRPCIRCLGAGFFPQYLHVEGGICFRCRGARFDVEICDAGTSQAGPPSVPTSDR